MIIEIVDYIYTYRKNFEISLDNPPYIEFFIKNDRYQKLVQKNIKRIIAVPGNYTVLDLSLNVESHILNIHTDIHYMYVPIELEEIEYSVVRLFCG